MGVQANSSSQYKEHAMMEQGKLGSEQLVKELHEVEIPFRWDYIDGTRGKVLGATGAGNAYMIPLLPDTTVNMKSRRCDVDDSPIHVFTHSLARWQF